MSDVIVMEIEVKGPMEPYKILLEPYAVVIPGEVFIFTTICRQFKVFFSSTYLGIVLEFSLQYFVLGFHVFVSVRCGTTAGPSSPFSGRKRTVAATQ